jgi:hypothetical protein
MAGENRDQWLQHAMSELSRKIDALQHDVSTVKTDLSILRREFEKHIEDEQKELREIIGGFPNEDPRGHAEAHKKLIDQEKSDAEVVRDVKKKVISGGAWGLIVAVGYGLWEFIKLELKK